MDYTIATVALFIGCVLCAPLFIYLIKATWFNADDFHKGYKKEFEQDATEDFIEGFLNPYSEADIEVNKFALSNFIVLILPFIAATFLAVPIYFAIEWVLAIGQ